MTTFPKIMILSCFLALSSCATRYAPLSANPGSLTGYADAQLDSVTWNVGFFANPATDTVTVNRYVLYRAAELTAQRGFDYFLVLDYTRHFERAAVKLNPPTSLISGPDPLTAKPSDLRRELSLHGFDRCATLTIQMMHGHCPSQNPNAYSAQWMLASMGPTINR